MDQTAPPVRHALGMIETRGLVALIEAVDAMCKTASVVFAGWTAAGGGLVTAFVEGEVAAAKAATDAGAQAAARLGEVASVQVIPRPHEELTLIAGTEGHGEAGDRRGTGVDRGIGQALGLVETRGLVGLVEAADAMCKAASVRLVRTIPIGGGYVTTTVRGEVASVRAAVAAGTRAAEVLGEFVGAHVIAQPHESINTGFLG